MRRFVGRSTLSAFGGGAAGFDGDGGALAFPGSLLVAALERGVGSRVAGAGLPHATMKRQAIDREFMRAI